MCLASLLTNSILLASSLTPPSSWLSCLLDPYDLQVHDFASTGRGLRTLRGRNPGETILSVPECDALTVSSLFHRFPDLLNQARSSEHKFSDEQILAIGLIKLRGINDPYVSSLPTRQFSVLEIPTSILSYLPRAYQKIILAYQDHVERLYETINHVLDFKVSLADFQWAFATVRSRCIGVGDEHQDENGVVVTQGGEKRVMLPALDLLNHRFGADAQISFSSVDQFYELKSNISFAKGEQVFISYGEKRDNLKMLMTYGFCPPGNPNVVAFFDVSDLLHACSSARPAFFPPPVQQQLYDLMVKCGKDRDIFEYDGCSHQALNSLQVGIDMMAEIQKQFVARPDIAFTNDITTALIDTRTKEIENCMKMIQTSPFIETEWKHLINSIAILLRSELECCNVS